MVRHVIPFALGILIAVYVYEPVFANPLLLIIPLIVFLILTFITLKIGSHRYQWLFGLTLFLAFFATGYVSVALHDPRSANGYFEHSGKDFNQFVVRITEPPQEKAKSIKTTGSIMFVEDSVRWHEAGGNLLIYFAIDSASRHVRYGDVIIFNGDVVPVAPPANPHAFDYRKYLARSGIFHQTYLKTGNWKVIDSGMVNPVYALSFRIRNSMMDILKANGISGDEFAVVSAILLGYDDNLSPELRAKYAGAGALHVLCVSGLHVGIVFAVTAFLLAFLNRSKAGRLIRFFIIIAAIWSYALITGLSPSVQRAGVMFSFLALRRLGKYDADPYNLLAASAFLLLAVNPMLITKVGFQLSYAAVIAIIAVYNPIYKLIPVKNKLLDYLWSLLVISFAAQLGTFPLAVYYFHQFPVYFFLTNLIVIPLAWLIINTGMLTLLVALFWKGLAAKAGLLLDLLLRGLNGSVNAIATLPFSKAEGLVLLLPEVILIYLIIIFITRFLVSKKGSLLVTALSFSLLLLISFNVSRFRHLHQRKFIVYSIKGHTAIDIINGRKVCALTDSTLPDDKKAVAFNILNNRIYNACNVVERIDLDTTGQSVSTAGGVQFITRNFFLAADKRIALIDGDFSAATHCPKLRLDYVVLRNNPVISPKTFLGSFDTGTVILDASNSRWLVRKWAAALKDSTVNIYDVRHQGAFVIDL
jgi:competence protein ComEC